MGLNELLEIVSSNVLHYKLGALVNPCANGDDVLVVGRREEHATARSHLILALEGAGTVAVVLLAAQLLLPHVLVHLAAGNQPPAGIRLQVVGALVGYVWIKNSGILRLSTSAIEKSDVFAGTISDFGRLEYQKSGELGDGRWRYEIISPDASNDYLERKETLLITLKSSKLPDSSGNVYFRTVLPNGYEVTKLFEVLGV